MVRLALAVLIAVLAIDPCSTWDLPRPLAEFVVQVTGRTRKNAVIVRPKVLGVTPEGYKPKVNQFFDWLLGVEPHRPRMGDSGEQLVTRANIVGSAAPPPPPSRPRVNAEEVKTRLATDLDAILAEFKLKHPLEDIKGVSGTVTGDHGMVKWFGNTQRTNGKTVFDPLDEIQLKAEVGFEFNLNVTYEYHLRAAMTRDGHTTTLLRHQRAVFRATIVRPYSFYECYIRDPEVIYEKVSGEVDVEIIAPPKFNILGYQGGAISGRLFPQCHTDIADGIKKIVPSATSFRMTKYVKEMLGSKVC